MRNSRLLALLAVSGLLAIAQASAAVTVYTSDFIADGSRTGFNGFENATLGDAYHLAGGPGPYTEGGIAVQQINGDAGLDIWLGYNYWPGVGGLQVWYPDGADHGFTQVSLTGGVDFSSVGFNYNTGFGNDGSIAYELYEGNALVLAGSASLLRNSVNYLGFSGGGFNRIIMRDTNAAGFGPVANGGVQALAIDNVEITGGARHVPEQGNALVLTAGAVGLLALVRRQRGARRA